MFKYSDSFFIVIRNDFIQGPYSEPLSENIDKILKELEKHKIKSEKTNSWSLNFIGNEDGVNDDMDFLPELKYYNANNETKNILLKYSTSLYDWILPNLPEDLCFLKDDKYILASVSHNKDAIISNEVNFNFISD